MIGEALAEQFDRCWEMMRATIARFTPEQWRSGDRPRLVPARWALHAIEGADFYSRPREEAPSEKRFPVDWELSPAPALPGQEEILLYLEEVRAQVGDWLRGRPDEELFGENPFPWTGERALAFPLYALRHTTYHLGELGMLLRLLGAEETEWK